MQVVSIMLLCKLILMNSIQLLQKKGLEIKYFIFSKKGYNLVALLIIFLENMNFIILKTTLKWPN